MKLTESYKVKVTPEQSREVQELFFAQGGKWIDGDSEIDDDSIPPREYLCIEVNSKGSFIFGTYEKSFQCFDYKEIPAPELIALLSKEETKMTSLADFLKCEKVRCIKVTNCNDLTLDKEYRIRDLGFVIESDEGLERMYDSEYFEPVTETQATDSLDDTPMGTRTVNEFEVGDRVYWGANSEIYIIDSLHGDLANIECNGDVESVRIREICQATPENHALLCKLYPHIEFEKPPITGNELALAVLEKNDDLVFMADCFGMNGERMGMRVVTGFDGYNFCTDDGMSFRNVVPVDKYGTPLTSEVLDDC